MRSQQIRSVLAAIALLVCGVGVAAAQTQDTSGNGLLKGTFEFRHVAVQDVDANYNPTEVTATYGSITFDGAGNYTLAGFSTDNTVSSGAPQALSVTGTYAIGANGAGYVADPLYPADFDDYMYGAVSQGVFTGSSTEAESESYVLNDIFVAIPVGSSPSNAGFTTMYQAGLLDFTGASSSAIENALFALTPDGKGGLGTVKLSGQASNQSASTLMQTITGSTYNFNSDGSATLTFPLPTGVTSTNALLTGTRTLYISADGNFVLGWTTGGYDIIVGVKALSVTGSNSLSKGLYWTSALEDSPAAAGTDSYYGSTNGTGDSSGDAIVHERMNLSGALSFDMGLDDQIAVNSDGSTAVDVNGYQYNFGLGGQAFVATGTNGNFALLLGLRASSFSGTGVYLNPIGVANAASFQPITASIAPGELLVLYGTGLASGTIITPGAAGFPTTLGGVTVTMNNIPCPIYYVTPTQLSVIVPYEIASNATGLVNIQVTNNNVASNVVQMYQTDAAPGSFSQSATGIGLAAARHATTGAEITEANPATPGEYISLYMTGLGTVTPTITGGAIGSSTTLSWADVYNAGNLTVSFNDYGLGGSYGNPGTIQFAGLTPTLGGLYQINVQVPTSGLVAGNNVYVEFITDAADVNQIQIPYGTGGSTAGMRNEGSAVATVVRAETMKTHRIMAGRRWPPRGGAE